MKKLLKLILIMSIFTVYVVPDVNAIEVQPQRVELFWCSGSAAVNVVKTQSNVAELKVRTGKFVAPGATKTLTAGTDSSVSNSLSFSFLKGAIGLDYQISYSISQSESDSFTNPYPYDSLIFLELGHFYLYDVFTYDYLSYVGNESCTLSRNKTSKVYKGWSLALIPLGM